jgi:tetratricopeptide (TPR) repeat protein
LEEPLYVFKHPLIQEVVYDTLAEERRRRWHTTAGRALETLYAGRTDEVVEILAFHFGQTPEAEKAVDYAIRAAEKAQRRWANAEALAHFESALTRLATMADTEANRGRRIDAVIKQAEVKFALGQHAEHIQALERIRNLVEESADLQLRAAWHYWMGFLHAFTGERPDVAIAYCREAVAIAEAHGFDRILALAEGCLAQAHFVAGDLRRAVTLGERALASFNSRGDVWWACRTLWLLSFTANALGEWERSLGYCRRALEHGQAMNDLRLKVVGWYRTGSTHIQRGDLDSGLRACGEALALGPIPLDAAMIKAMHGYGLVKAGKAATGTAELADALAWFESSHLRYTRSVVALWLAEGWLRQGNQARAHAILGEVHATSSEFGYRFVEGVAARLLGECVAPTDPAAGARYLEDAVRALDAVGARNEVAKALVAQAELKGAAGDPEGAKALLERALALFEALGTLGEPRRCGTPSTPL